MTKHIKHLDKTSLKPLRLQEFEKHKKSFSSFYDNVVDFNEKFGLIHAGKPRELTAHESHVRIEHMFEELNEYEKAVHDGDLEGQFDALIDLIYVALGTAYWHNFPFNEGFDAVHAANMRKKRAASAAQSKRGTTLDVIKPHGWKPANLVALLAQKE